jgi:hypothetical protein
MRSKWAVLEGLCKGAHSLACSFEGLNADLQCVLALAGRVGAQGGTRPGACLQNLGSGRGTVSQRILQNGRPELMGAGVRTVSSD